MWLGLVAAAFGGGAPETLHPGEFYGQNGGWTGTAYTTPRGEVALHPFIRSSVGVLKNLDVKAPILGQILMPQLGMEVAFVQNERFALSLEGAAQAPWSFDRFDLGVVPHASVRLSRGVMVDLSVGIHGITRDRTIEILASEASPEGFVLQDSGLTAVRPELSLDLRIADPTWFVLTARSDVHGWATDGTPQGTAGAYFVHGKRGLGCSIGANLALLGLGGLQDQIATAEEAFGDQVSLPEIPNTLLVPSPHFQMWFRI